MNVEVWYLLIIKHMILDMILFLSILYFKTTFKFNYVLKIFFPSLEKLGEEIGMILKKNY